MEELKVYIRHVMLREFKNYKNATEIDKENFKKQRSYGYCYMDALHGR